MKMNQEKLNRLKEILSVPTHSREEYLMIEYLKNVLTEKGYDHYVDKHGNIYVTKGSTEWYPCFIAHTDTVHEINKNLTVVQEVMNDKDILRGVDGITKKDSGIGGDDKCGVYLALEMLDTLPNVKIALFVSEEIGCLGSQHADPEFFKNVGYVIQYDSPGGNSMSLTLMGRYLFKQKSEFANKVTGLIKEHGITDWAYHPYTDVWQIIEKFDIATLNLAAGYYRYHTDKEYVVIDDVQNGYELGLKLVEELGENRYENPKEERTYPSKYLNTSKSYSSTKTKTLLVEDEDEGKEDNDEWGEIFNRGEFFYSERREGTGYGPYYNRGYYYDEDYDY